MEKLRIVFMGTPDFAVPCLDRLVCDGHEIAAVVTQPDRPKGRGKKMTGSPVKEFAATYKFNTLQPEKIKEAGFIEQLEIIKPDVIVVVAFGQFLPQKLLDLPRLGCINVHASLLPKYRGAAPIHWAVINGETNSGVTTMLMDVGMDTGDMLFKSQVEIGPDETTGELHDKLKNIGANVLSQTLNMLATGSVKSIKQENSEATYAPMLKRETERVDWHRPAQDIHNLIRGLNPWPGAYCLHKNKILKLWRSELTSIAVDNANPGKVLVAKDDYIVIATGSGAIRLVEVQPESKRQMSCRDFIRGYDLNVGEILG